MFTIRNFKGNDLEMIQSWWKAQDEFPPTMEMLPPESTFICEVDDMPLVAITVYLTNSLEFCMLDNFIGNPEYSNNLRREASTFIVKYAEEFAKDMGYKSIMCLALKDKLKEYYQTFGYTLRFENASTFNKELV